MTGVDVSELWRVRAASYGAACCAAFLVLVVALMPVRSRVAFETMPAAHAVIVTEAPRLVHTPEVQRETPADAVVRARARTDVADGPAARLWTYSASGQIVFDWAEQYERCMMARARRASEADCPDPNETRELVLREGGPARFDLRGIIMTASN